MYDAIESIDLDKLDDFHLFMGHVFNQTKKDKTLTNIQLRKLVKNIEDRLECNAVYWLLLNILYQIYPEMINSEKILDLWRQKIDQFMQNDGNDMSLWSTKLIYLISKAGFTYISGLSSTYPFGVTFMQKVRIDAKEYLCRFIVSPK